VQGLALNGPHLYAAESTMGVIAFRDAFQPPWSAFTPFDMGKPNEGSGVQGTPYAYDVEAAAGRLYISDASTGILSIVGTHDLDEGGYSKEDIAFNRPAVAKKTVCRK
jgi:hypothetical protein